MLFFHVSFGPKDLQIEHPAGAIEFGRGPERDGIRRVTLEDPHSSRDHLRVEELPGERVRLENLSQRLPVTLDDGRQVEAGETLEVPIPLRATLGRTEVTVTSRRGEAVAIPTTPSGMGAEGLLTVAQPVALPGHRSAAALDRTGSAILAASKLGESPSADTLVRWMETVLALQRSSTKPSDLYEQTNQAMIEMIGLDVALVLIRQEANWKVVARRSREEDDGHSHPGREFSLTVLNKVLAERRTFYQDLSALGAHESLRNVDAVVVSPIFGREDEVTGVLYGVRRGQGAGKAVKVSALEAQLVQLLAAAVGANQARMTATRVERDLEIGRSIQSGFLPQTLPQLPGWEIAAHFEPAREVSGDFYDVFALSSDHLALVIADVCDKGVGAALFMTLFRSLIRSFAQQAQERGLFGTSGLAKGASAADRRRAALLADVIALSTVQLTNQYVAGTHSEACMFVTLFFAVLDVGTGAITYVNGGHDSPVLVGAGGTLTRLTQTGPVVGYNPDAVYDIARAQLGPGDALFTYTDGVTEARDPAGRFFTEKHLLSLMAPSPSASALLNKVVAALRTHVAGAEPSDDVTMLAVRRTS